MALNSNLDVHTKHVLVDQKMALASNDTVLSLVQVCSLALCAPCLPTFVAFTVLMPQEDETEENSILSHRNINISQLETNCSRALPDASKLSKICIQINA